MTTTPQALAQRAILKELLRGRSDAEIVALVDELGPRAVLDQIFAEMRRRMGASRLEDQRMVLQWEITDCNRQWLRHIKVRNGRATWSRGPSPQPWDIRFVVSLPEFLRIVAGVRMPLWAALRGRARVHGSLRKARRALRWIS